MHLKKQLLLKNISVVKYGYQISKFVTVIEIFIGFCKNKYNCKTTNM